MNRENQHKEKQKSEAVGGLLYELCKSGFYGEVNVKIHKNAIAHVQASPTANTAEQIRSIPGHLGKVEQVNQQIEKPVEK